MEKSENLDGPERKGVICHNCGHVYNHETNLDEGYETISRCPKCKSPNSVRKY
jgi:predicted Zn-ribbon and HTH transcriptional regulator